MSENEEINTNSEKVDSAINNSANRGLVEVLVLGIDSNGLLHIDTSLSTVFATHYLLNRAVFEVNLLEAEALAARRENVN